MGVGDEEDASFGCFCVGGHRGCVLGAGGVGRCCCGRWLISVSIWPIAIAIAIAIVGWEYAG